MKSPPPRSLRSARVFSTLKGKILDFTYAPGQPLTEQNIARDLKVSRTPIREALRRLEGEELVQLIPNKGAIVIGLTEAGIRETYLIRQALEGVAARRAAEQLSEENLRHLRVSLDQAGAFLAAGEREAASDTADELHRVILAVGGTPRIRRMVASLRDLTGCLQELAVALPGRLERSIQEHTRVWEALRHRDGEGAERLMREHIVSTERDVIAAHRNRLAA